MSVEDLLLEIGAALERARVPYMLTGSFASSVHGVARATQDIDIVIDPTRDQLISLLEQFPETEYYASRDAAIEALDRQSQFNVIDHATGWKIDFIFRKTREFSGEEFDRRRLIDFYGSKIHIATAEDVVIAKLEWAKLSQSERQLDDVAGIIRVQRGALDTPYIERWVLAMDLQEQWRAALAKAN